MHGELNSWDKSNSPKRMNVGRVKWSAPKQKLAKEMDEGKFR